MLDTLSKKRLYAFISLTLENIALHYWRSFFWIILFCGLWMLGLSEFLGQNLNILTSLIFSLGLLYFFKYDVLSFKLPKRSQIDFAIEKKSKLPQGQISLLKDCLANPRTYNARDLWLIAQNQILASFKLLKAPFPNVILTRKDPSALRYIALLIFISGIMVSGPQWQSRITNGALPFTPQFNVAQNKRINLWVKPPSYTQMPQIHVVGAHANDTILDIPEDSEIKLRLHSILGNLITPELHIGETTLPMEYSGEGFFTAETTIVQGDIISVTQGIITRGKWPYNFIKDSSPEIYSHTPKKTPEKEPLDEQNTDIATKTKTHEPYDILSKGQISVPLMVRDDYSVKDLTMTMDLDEMVEERPLGNKSTQTRLIISQPNIDFKISPIYDMTWHTWAGLPVTFEYKVTDHKQQSTTLEKIYLVLPEKKFEHPMAKSLIAMRKRLAWDYADSYIDIANNLETLLGSPDFFQHNKTTFLAIKTAAARLAYSNHSPQEVRMKSATEVINLLWVAAITIEEGNLSLAMRELRDAQEALENAMRDPNASEEKISDLMQNLRDKMSAYFAEMQKEMQKRMADGEDFPAANEENFGQIISPDSLSKLMQEIESAMRNGDTQKAQELMSKLQRMMEMMDPSMAVQLPYDMQAMKDGVNELKELIDTQEELIARTSANNPLPDKSEQQALRYILGQLMLDVSEKLDEIPDEMGLAEQEMRLSENALEEKSPATSIPHQEKAIEYLQDAQENLNDQFAARMQQMVGIGSGSGQQYDPLGRPYDKDSSDEDGTGKNSNVQLPDDDQKKKVDEILETLRDRSGDQNRSDQALDYFLRLLRQF